MTDELVIVPNDGEGYVELAKTKTGRVFRKHILNKGELRHPVTGKTIKVDDSFVKKLKTNFDNGVCDIVQVPLANEKNEHTEAPDRNIGEVVDIEVKDDKVYAILDVRDKDHADKLGKTYLGASAMMHLDYTDTKTGNKVGPTLLHSCVTNRPYVTGLEPYEEIVAATSDSSDGAVVLLTDDVVVVDEPQNEEKDVGDKANTQETTKPSLDELLSTLKADHGIDVPSLQAQARDAVSATELSRAVTQALTDAGVVKLTADEGSDTVSTEDVVGAVADLARNNVALTDRVQTLEKRDAESAVDALIAEGKVMPKQRAAMVELKLTNQSMFDALVPDEPLIKLNNEAGKTPPDDEAHKLNIDEEIARLSALVSTNAKTK